MSKVRDKLKLENLKIGMEVSVGELLEIYDTYFVLTDTTGHGSDMNGTLAFYGKSVDDYANDLIKRGAFYMYLDRHEMLGEVEYYDE